MTDELLKGHTAQVLNMAMTDARKEGGLHIVIAAYHAEDQQPLHRMRMIENQIEKRFGRNWLNNGPMKDAVYATLRLCFNTMPPEAVFLAFQVHNFKHTDKWEALSPEEQQPLVRRISKSHAEQWVMVKEGWLEPGDGIVCVGQTPLRVCMGMQALKGPGRQLDGQPHLEIWDQHEFSGRLKMFGDPNLKPPDNFTSSTGKPIPRKVGFPPGKR